MTMLFGCIVHCSDSFPIVGMHWDALECVISGHPNMTMVLAVVEFDRLRDRCALRPRT